MLSQKSLRTKFIIQLASGSSMLILIFSTMLYHYIKINIFETVVQVLNQEAIKLSSQNITNSFNFYTKELGHTPINAKIIQNEKNLKKPKYTSIKTEEKSSLVLEYPYKNSIIILDTDTTFYNKLVSQVLTDIIIINATMIFLILFFALFLSRSLLIPVKLLSAKLSKLNEIALDHIDENEIPLEFKPLGMGINRLIDRIHTFIGYQKELFIGIAHELKTPLAVMKTKNEVTLLKPRDNEKYIEALKNNNISIDNMNKMISSILEIGRQEGAQFEKPIEIDIIKLIEETCLNFKILAQSKDKAIITKLKPDEFFMSIQPNLFLHIIQNFIQNAIKFSPQNSAIIIKSTILDDYFKLDVVDEGIGIDESLDHFAPFKRSGNKSGAGLGLFLAKGAADAMNAQISLKNRSDQKGVIATIKIPISKTSKKLNKAFK